jgi:hypothetical protein
MEELVAKECKKFRELGTPAFDVTELIEEEQVLFKLYQIDDLLVKINVIMFLFTSDSTVPNFIQNCEVLASTTGALKISMMQWVRLIFN